MYSSWWYIYLSVERSKNSPLNLSQEQITTDTNILNEFMTAINNNDIRLYNSLSNDDMNASGTFEHIVREVKDNFGDFKSAIYKDAIKSKDYNILVFNGLFTNKNNIEITLSLDMDNKVAGIHFK